MTENTQNTPEKPKTDLSEICEALELTLTRPDPHLDILERQSDLLDCLFYAVMRHNLQEDMRRGQFSEDRLNTALRIQKQCVDTLKAVGALDYMRAVSFGKPRIYPPPLKIGERKEGPEDW